MRENDDRANKHFLVIKLLNSFQNPVLRKSFIAYSSVTVSRQVERATNDFASKFVFFYIFFVNYLSVKKIEDQ